MKDSKEKEHRISNLKKMIDNVDINEASEEIEEDEELINYLNDKDNDDFEIDDEFIYHPNEDNGNAINLEENPINEDYIIKTPKEKEFENDDSTDDEELNDEYPDEISESFDNLIHSKVGKTPLLAIVSSILGLVLIAISAYIYSTRHNDRVIDNVVSGETNFMAIIFLIFGIMLFGYGIFRFFGIKNPFESLSSKINSIEDDTVKESSKKKEEPEPKALPKSNIPLDKDSYKIGEFNIKDLKNKLKKPSQPKKPTPPTQEELDKIPPAREKPQEKKGLTSEEIEEIEYEQVVLDGESIDDIFAEVEDIEDIPIISIDSEEKKEK